MPDVNAVATAVVRVRPDLTGFAAQLTKDLRAEIGKVGTSPRGVRLRPDLTGFSTQLRTELRNAISKLPASATTITLKAKFEANTAAQLKRQIGVITNIPVTFTTAPGAVQSLRNQAGAAAAVAGVPAAGAAAAAAAPAVTSAAATTSLAGGTAAVTTLASTQVRAGATTSDLTKETLALARAQEAVAKAEAKVIALGEADTATKEAQLSAATRSLAVRRQEEQVAAERLATAAAAPAAAAAAAREREAAEQLATKKRQTQAAAAAKQQEQAAVAAARHQADAIRAARLEVGGQVRTAIGRTGTDEQRLAAETSITQQLKTANAELAAQRNLGNASIAKQIEAETVLLERYKQQILAANLAGEAQLRFGALAQAGAEKLGVEAAAAAKLTAANAALATAEERVAAARAGGLRRQISPAETGAATALAEQQAAQRNLDEIRRQRAIGPLTSAQAGATAALQKAGLETKSLATRLDILTKSEASLTKVLKDFSVAQSGATAEDLAAVRAKITKVAETRADIAAQLEAAIAAQRAATIQATADREAAAAQRIRSRELAAEARLQSQVSRGAIATSAGFLGLRGAVLSASGGFLAATIAVTGLAKIIGTGAQLEQSLNVFQATAGATADEMARVSDQAQKLGADLTLPATSANDAAAAMTELSKAGLSVTDSLAAARGVLQLAAAASIDVKTAANITATELNAFGLAGDQAGRVANLLAGASVAAQGEITDFALAFQQVSAVANQADLSLEQTTAILTQFARAGLRGSDAGTSLRTMLLRLVPTSKAAAEAQNELGIRLNKNLPVGRQFRDLVDQYTVALRKLDPIARQQILTRIFGQDAIRGATISLTQGSAALAKVQGQVSEGGQAADLANARMKGLTGAIEGLQSASQTLAGDIGTSLLPPLESVARSLSSVVQAASTTTDALTALGNLTIKPVVNLLGGTDVVAQVGLAVAAGAGIRALIRKTRGDTAAAQTAEAAGAEKSALAQTEAQATIATGATKSAQTQVKAAGLVSRANLGITNALKEVDIAYRGVGVSAVRAADLEVGAANNVSEALRRQLVIEREIAAGKAAAARTAARAEKARGVGTAGLTAGIGLSVLGGIIPGQAGEVASAAGTGAILGSFFPGPGTAIGAIGFGGLTALNDAIKANQKQEADLKKKWNSMTFAEQQTFLLQHFPNEADPNAPATILQQTIKESLKKSGINVSATTAPAQFTLKQQSQTLIPNLLSRTQTTPGSPRAELERRLKNLQDLREGTQKVADEAGNASPVAENARRQIEDLDRQIRATTIQIAHLAGDSVADFVKKLGGLNVPVAGIAVQAFDSLGALFTAIEQGAKKADLKRLQAQAAIDSLFTPGLTLNAAGLGTAGPAGLKDVVQKVTLNQSDLDALNVAITKTSGTTSELVAVLEEQERHQAAALARLQNQLSLAQIGKTTVSLAQQKKLLDAAIKAANDLDSTRSQIESLTKTDTSFSVSSGAQIAVIQAGSTKSLVDDLNAAQDVLDETNAGLAKAIARGDEKKDIDALRIQQAQARADVQQKRQAIIDKAAQDSADALAFQQERLRIAADAAGNIGGAENKYIAFLKRQVDLAKDGTKEELQAQKALNDEIEKRRQALQTLLDARLGLRDDKLATALARADLTEGTKDNERLLRQKIANDNADIARLKKIVGSEGLKTAAGIAAARQIEQLRQDVAQQLLAIKNLKGGTSTSIQDLFKEAVSNFQSFGSNIAGRNGALSPQDVRASFGLNLGRGILEQISQSQLSEAEKQTKLLTDLLAAFKSPGSVSPARGRQLVSQAGNFGGWRGAQDAANNLYGTT